VTRQANEEIQTLTSLPRIKANRLVMRGMSQDALDKGHLSARKNLSVVVDKAKISNFQDAFIKKAEAVGFVIENCDKVLLPVTESDA
jgi:hypothetical protein